MFWGITINNPLEVANTDKIQITESTSYMGRIVRWLNNTPGGQFAKGVGHLMLAGGAFTIGVLYSPVAVISGLFAALLVGITRISNNNPLVLTFLLLAAVDVGLFELTGQLWNKAMKNFTAMDQLSDQGK